MPHSPADKGTINTPAGDSAMDETNDAVKVNIVAGSAAGGTSMVDNATFTPGSSSGTPAFYEVDDAAPSAASEGSAGIGRMTPARGQHVNLRDNSGAEITTLPVSAASLPLPTGAATQATLAAIQTAVEIIDNIVSGSEAQVDVLTLPADPLGANADAAVAAGAAGSISAKLRLMTSQLDAIKTAVELIDNAIAGTEMQVDVVAALPAGTNAIGKLAANSGVDIGDVDVTSIAAGSNLIGDVGIQGRATGGTSTFRSIDLDETEEEVKATAGTIYHIAAFNRTAAPLYLKLYNLTAVNTTVGTSTPTHTYVVPANADSDGAGFLLSIPQGIAFSTAISAAVTTGVADADVGAPGANDCVVVIQYT